MDPPGREIRLYLAVLRTDHRVPAGGFSGHAEASGSDHPSRRPGTARKASRTGAREPGHPRGRVPDHHPLQRGKMDPMPEQSGIRRSWKPARQAVRIPRCDRSCPYRRGVEGKRREIPDAFRRIHGCRIRRGAKGRDPRHQQGGPETLRLHAGRSPGKAQHPGSVRGPVREGALQAGYRTKRRDPGLRGHAQEEKRRGDGLPGDRSALAVPRRLHPRLPVYRAGCHRDQTDALAATRQRAAFGIHVGGPDRTDMPLLSRRYGDAQEPGVQPVFQRG